MGGWSILSEREGTVSKLQQILQSGRLAVTAEISPPKHAAAQQLKQQARLLGNYIDAANITDCQTAVVRMSSIGAAAHILAAGVEPVIQMTCRDRNRIAIQSDLLGAYSLGARNLLCLSGDHQSFGNHPTAKNVYDLDSIQLIQMVRRMKDEGLFFNGEKIKDHPPRFFVGAVANPFADPFAYRVDRLEKKIEAGAEFIQTQSIFDLERFAAFMEACVARGLTERAHILASVTPLRSWRAALFLQTGVPGMIMPDEVVRRLKEAADPAEEGLRICVAQIKQIREKIKGVAGFHLIAINWPEAVPELVQRAGLVER